MIRKIVIAYILLILLMFGFMIVSKGMNEGKVEVIIPSIVTQRR